jgi:hypothetical protein
MLEISSKSPRIVKYSKDSRKTDLTELWPDRLFETLVANHQSSTLDKKYSMVIYKDWDIIWVI